MATAKMVPKLVVIPGRATEEEKLLLGGRVLGVGYDMDEDKIIFRLTTTAQVVDPTDRRRKVAKTWTDREVRELVGGAGKLSLRQVLL